VLGAEAAVIAESPLHEARSARDTRGMRVLQIIIHLIERNQLRHLAHGFLTVAGARSSSSRTSSNRNISSTRNRCTRSGMVFIIFLFNLDTGHHYM
jgi:hypothetical protein